MPDAGGLLKEPAARLKIFCKFATAAQHFLLLLQKKTLAKENEPGGISISPRSPLEPTRKTASVFLDFSRDNKNGVEIWQTARPMRIRTAWQVLNAKLICRIHSNAAAYKFGVP
ncbi:MAG: hypothetical protein ACLR8L_01900 [Oscillospiraceae bacterium]